MEQIAQNLQAIEKNIEDACQRSNRAREDVTLISVSKTKPIEALRAAYAAGARDFGENKVQELVEKMPQMPGDVRWHMIGHLQRNKVKYIVGKVALIHSVDSMRLAEEISKESLKQGVVSDILLEVNVAAEESKFGTSLEAAKALYQAAQALPNLCVKGFMTIAPYTLEAEENRPYFAALRQLSVDIMGQNAHNVDKVILSMGMTGDYCVAIEEGATHVRVGTGIFGERNYFN